MDVFYFQYFSHLSLSDTVGYFLPLTVTDFLLGPEGTELKNGIVFFFFPPSFSSCRFCTLDADWFAAWRHVLCCLTHCLMADSIVGLVLKKAFRTSPSPRVSFPDASGGLGKEILAPNYVTSSLSTGERDWEVTMSTPEWEFRGLVLGSYVFKHKSQENV